MLRMWQRAILRAGKQLDRSPVLCELHFEERFIVRHYTHIVNGQEVKIERGWPRFTDGAVPSFFINTPAYLSRKLPQKRQSRTSRGEVLGKRLKQNDGEAALSENSSPGDEAPDHEEARNICTLEKLAHIQGEKLPSEFWSQNIVVEAPKSVVFSVCAQAGDSVCLRKVVLCSAEGTHFHCLCKVFQSKKLKCWTLKKWRTFSTLSTK